MRSIYPKAGMIYVLFSPIQQRSTRARIISVNGDIVEFEENGMREESTVDRILTIVTEQKPNRIWSFEYPHSAVLDLPDGI